MQLVDAEGRVAERLASEPALLLIEECCPFFGGVFCRNPVCVCGVHFAELFHDAQSHVRIRRPDCNDGIGAAHAPLNCAI